MNYKIVDFFFLFPSECCRACDCHKELSGRPARQVSAVAGRVEGGVAVLAGKCYHRLKTKLNKMTFS